MKILLIGHSIIDNIDNKTLPGGVFYSTLGFLLNMNPQDELYVVTSWNKKYYSLFEKLYSKVNQKYFQYFEEMPEVFLDTSGNEERREVYKNISSTLNTDLINDLNSFDGILINMITGFDISLQQLKTLRKNYDGKIYFDIHSLARGIDKNMNRNFRPIPNVEEWLSCIDILQCNNNELQTIFQGEENNAAKFVLSSGVNILLITKADKGSCAYFYENNKIKKLEMNAINVETLNKIGCGDIFGATFFYNYLKIEEIESSLSIANEAGAKAASTRKLTILIN